MQVEGSLIAPSYMDKLAEQVNDELQLKKELNIGDIASKFELPPAFLIGVAPT